MCVRVCYVATACNVGLHERIVLLLPGVLMKVKTLNANVMPRTFLLLRFTYFFGFLFPAKLSVTPTDEGQIQGSVETPSSLTMLHVQRFTSLSFSLREGGLCWCIVLIYVRSSSLLLANGLTQVPVPCFMYPAV